MLTRSKGPNVPASCISLQMSKMRKKALGLGVKSKPAQVTVRRRGPAPSVTESVSKRKRGGISDDARY